MAQCFLSVLQLHPSSNIKQDHCDVLKEHGGMELDAWSEKMRGMFEISQNKIQVSQTFGGSIELYSLGTCTHANLYPDRGYAENSLSHISIDTMGEFFLFTVCTDGESRTLDCRYATRAPLKARILALDSDRPIRMLNRHHQFSAFFVSSKLMESILPNSDVLYGRSIDVSTSLARLMISHKIGLDQQIIRMSVEQAKRTLNCVIELLAASFSKQVRITCNHRGAARAAIFGQVRSYIKSNLEDPDLSAEAVLKYFRLPRDTLYRMFEHDGGIANFISECRLRAAADEIAKFPHLALKDIAYGVGFSSASAFSRAFRRCYDISPHELREYVDQRFSAGCSFYERKN